jgi:hypothetical protein
MTRKVREVKTIIAISIATIVMLAAGCGDKEASSLEQGTDDERVAAVEALAKGGAKSVPTLIMALGDKNYDVRQKATDTLAAMGAEVAPALITGMDNEGPLVRKNAATVLGNMGPAAKEALPAIKAAVKAHPGHCGIAYAHQIYVKLEGRHKGTIPLIGGDDGAKTFVCRHK